MAGAAGALFVDGRFVVVVCEPVAVLAGTGPGINKFIATLVAWLLESKLSDARRLSVLSESFLNNS